MSKLISLIFVIQCLLGLAYGQFLWGGITMKNNGGYVSKLTITYKLDDKYMTVDSGRYPTGQARNVAIPPEATNVLVQGYVDIFINNWSIIFADSIGTPQFKCYAVGGTTLNTNWGAIDC